MKATPWILGAIIFAPFAGAAIGQNIGTEPLQQPVDVTETIPDRPRVVQPLRRSATQSMPNQYPLKTPDGVIEVSELALHGRYRERYQRMATFSDGQEYVQNDRWLDADLQNSSRAAAMLDAQQPRIEPVQRIENSLPSRQDRAQDQRDHADRRIAHIAQLNDRSAVTDRGEANAARQGQSDTVTPRIISVAPESISRDE